MVILGHLELGRFSDWIYTFHMPLFFFLSGCLLKETDAFLRFLQKKIRGILIPYFSICTILNLYFIAEDLILGRFSGSTAAGYFISMFVQKRYTVLWFLTVLFLVNIGFYLLTRLTKKGPVLPLAAAAAGVIGILYYRTGRTWLPWNLDACATAAVPFAAGILYRRAGFPEIGKTKTRQRLFTGLLLAGNLIFWMLSASVSGKTRVLDMYTVEYGIPALTLLSALCGILFTVQVSRMFSWKPLQVLGTNSLVFFGFHLNFCFSLICNLLVWQGMAASNDIETATPAGKAICFALTLLICTVLSRLFACKRLRFIVGK